MPSFSVPMHSFAALFARAFHSLSCMNSQSLSRRRQLILSILGKRFFLNFLLMKRFPRLSIRQEKTFCLVPRVFDRDQEAAIGNKLDFKYKILFVVISPAVPANRRLNQKITSCSFSNFEFLLNVF